jgi:hydrogenase maturation protein HypF
MGRLFDAAASLLGVRQTVTYEAQGAIELEALADERVQDHYHIDIHENEAIVFDPASLWRDFLADLRSGVERSVIAARFHRAVARLIVETCALAREKTGINTVALTGGVFQNVLLLGSAKLFLQEKDFRVLTHTLVPPNDGGLALGQALIAQRAEKVPAP